MSTLSKLTALGVKENEIRQGEVIELDTLTLKDAKKEKWSEVTNAEDSADVIAAYAGDLAATLQANETLEEDNNELSAQVTHLSQENGQLSQALQTGHLVDQRIEEFSRLMDDMEASLLELTNAKKVSESERDDLQAKLTALREENSRLNDIVTEVQVERDNLKVELENKEAEVVALDEQLVRYDEAYDSIEERVNKVLAAFFDSLVEAGIQFEEPK